MISVTFSLWYYYFFSQFIFENTITILIFITIKYIIQVYGINFDPNMLSNLISDY